MQRFIRSLPGPAALLLLATALFPAALFARGGLAVLPFRVEGDPARSGLKLPAMSERLQEASVFLLSISREYRLQSTTETNAALKELGWRPEQPLTPDRAEAVCLQAGADYLLGGSARFVSRESIFLKATVYFCGRNKTVQSQATAKHTTLQQNMRRMLDEATPFLQPRPQIGVENPQTGRAVDLAVILDFSGSMSEDLPAIFRGLDALQQRLPDGSRIGAITIQAGNNGDRLDAIRMTRAWSPVLQDLQQRRVDGTVTANGLEEALGIVSRYRGWQGQRKLLVFSDAALGGRRADLENYLRRIARNGVEIRLFSLLRQSYEDREEWRRLARTLRLEDPGVLYGREVSLQDGEELFFVMQGRRFFLSERNLKGDVVRGRLSDAEIRPIETIHFQREKLNLEHIPDEYARLRDRRVSAMGPVHSNLELRILDAAVSGLPEEHSAPRVSVRNEGTAFWLRVSDRDVRRELARARQTGDKIYIGFRPVPASSPGERVANLAEPVYTGSQGAVPLLFVTTWRELNQRPASALNGQDTVFVLVEVLEIGDDGSDILQ